VTGDTIAALEVSVHTGEATMQTKRVEGEMEKPQARPAGKTSEERNRELSDSDLAQVSGGGPHVRVFDGSSGLLLDR